MTPPIMRGTFRGFLCGVALAMLAAGPVVGMESGHKTQGHKPSAETAKPAHQKTSSPVKGQGTHESKTAFLPVVPKRKPAVPAAVGSVLPLDVNPAALTTTSASVEGIPQSLRILTKPKVVARDGFSHALATLKRSLTWPREHNSAPRPTIYGDALAALHDGHAEEAYDMLRPYLDGDSGGAPEHLNWLAGLSAYRMGEYSRAENHFKASADAASGDPWLRAAAYFWASRAALLDDNYRAARPYLQAAAEEKRTFYGIVAQRALGQDLELSWNKGNETAYYPLVDVAPREGWKVDPALLHAFIRQESRFTAAAQSPSGAMGLMQIMPSTAALYTQGNKDSLKEKLKDPATNISIGQNYIKRLASETDGRLFSLVMAYNAGPVAVRSWERGLEDIRDKDPLLFIELSPYAETRNFVERVVANYWIYRDRLGQPNETLDAVAGGDVPVYSFHPSAEMAMAN